jgi:hypothetical protein
MKQHFQLHELLYQFFHISSNKSIFICYSNAIIVVIFLHTSLNSLTSGKITPDSFNAIIKFKLDLYILTNIKTK